MSDFSDGFAFGGSIPRPGRSGPSGPPGNRDYQWSDTVHLPSALAVETVGFARSTLADRLDAFAEKYGCTVTDLHWSGDTGPVGDTITLTALLHGRTDGVWGEIRLALQQDADDRVRARQEAADGLAPREEWALDWGYD